MLGWLDLFVFGYTVRWAYSQVMKGYFSDTAQESGWVFWHKELCFTTTIYYSPPWAGLYHSFLHASMIPSFTAQYNSECLRGWRVLGLVFTVINGCFLSIYLVYCVYTYRPIQRFKKSPLWRMFWKKISVAIRVNERPK